LAAAFFNMSSFSMKGNPNWTSSGSNFISIDFKLHREGSSTSNKSGTNERI
jgi:hypothetical protein